MNLRKNLRKNHLTRGDHPPMKIGNRVVVLAALAVGIIVGSGWRFVRADGIPDSTPLFYGGLLQQNGIPIDDPQRFIVLRLWPNAVAQGGEKMLCETKSPMTTVVAGRFRIALDSGCVPAVNENRNVWVEVIDGSTSLGRAKVGAAPYAVEAQRAMDAIGDLHPKSIVASGNVGIGTANPTEKLDVAGNVKLGDDRAVSSLAVGQFGHRIGREPQDGSLYIGGGQASIILQNKVGIGTVNPNAQLEVKDGNLSLGSYSNAPSIRYIGLPREDGSFEDNVGGASIYFENQGSSHQAIGFKTHRQGVSHTTRMYIDSSGNVGIGTTAPRARLHMSGMFGLSGYLAPFAIENAAGADVVDIDFNAYGIMQGGSASNPGRMIRLDNRGGQPAIQFWTRAAGTPYPQGIDLAKVVITENGNVGIGTIGPNNRLAVVGNIAATGAIQGGVGAPDIAENIAASEIDVGPADVVVADPAGAERIVRARRPYDSSVLGVISTRPGMLVNAQRADVEPGTARDASQRPLALAGRVPVNVTLEAGPIRPGDLLTTSSTAGHAMRAAEPWRGGIIGTALEAFPCRSGDVDTNVQTGRIVVFVNLQPAPAADPRVVSRLEARIANLEASVLALADVKARLAALEAAESAKLAKRQAQSVVSIEDTR